MKKKEEQQKLEIRGFVPMKILRNPDLEDRTGLSRVTRWRLEREGKFPKKIKLSKRCVGWSENEILQWLQERAEAR